MIKKDATTQSELVEWFGPPSSRTMEPDGGKVLTWRFAPTKVGTPRSFTLTDKPFWLSTVLLKQKITKGLDAFCTGLAQRPSW